MFATKFATSLCRPNGIYFVTMHGKSLRTLLLTSGHFPLGDIVHELVSK